MGEPIETNLEGLEMMSRMLAAIQEMRTKITELQNEKGICWREWGFAYEVDDILIEAGVDQDDDDIED